MRSFITLVSTVLLIVVLAGPAAAATRFSRDTRVVLTGGLTLDADERSSDIVVFDGPVVIDGEVDGTVVVFNGTVSVSGNVGEDLVVFNGAVTVNDGATVGGDVVTGQAASIAPGATIGGDVRQVTSKVSFGFLGRFVVWLAYSVSTLILGFLLILVAPRGLEAAVRTVRERVGPAIGWGFLLFFGLPIAALLVIATLVGIPLGLGVLAALFLLYTVGYTVSAWIVGRTIVKPPSGRALAFFVGWLILRGVGLVPFLGGLAWFAAAVFGLGVLTVAAWRARAGPAEVSAAFAPAVPPPPAYPMAPPPP